MQIDTFKMENNCQLVIKKLKAEDITIIFIANQALSNESTDYCRRELQKWELQHHGESNCSVYQTNFICLNLF